MLLAHSLAIGFQKDSASHPPKAASILYLDKILTQKGIPCNTLWHYTTSDSSLYAASDYDDVAWQRAETTIDLTKIKDWSGKGWFRLHVRGDSTLVRQHLSLFINHRNASELYLDGILLYSFGKIGNTYQDEIEEGTNEIPVPMQISGGKHHVIALRYSNRRERYLRGLYPQALSNWSRESFSVSIRDYSEQIKLTLRNRSLRLIVAMIPLGILLYLSLQHGLMYAFTKRERLNLYVALFTLAMAMLAFTMMYRFISTTGREPMIWNEIVLPFEIALAMLMLGAAIASIAGYPDGMIWRILPLIMAATLVISRFILPATAWNIVIIVILIAEFSRVAYMLRNTNSERRAGSSIVGVGLALCVLSGVGTTIIAILRAFDIIWLYTLLQYIMFLSMPVSLAFYTARRFDRINDELSNQLDHIKALSDRTIEQEQEKQRLMERQKEELERIVEERTQQLQVANDELSKQKAAVQQANMQLLKRNVSIAAEQEKSEELLLSILPEPIAKRLKNGEQTIADRYEEVTVLFADIAGFTRFASHIDPQDLVKLLDKVFSEFDSLVERFGAEKIKTIGDAYMVVGGLQHHTGEHTENIARLAIAMQDAIAELSGEMGVIGLTVRIGLHRGAAVAGVIGKKKPSYDLWGDTVNIASRMESHGEAGKIHVSEEIFLHLVRKFTFRERGEIRVKGRGTMRTYFLEEERTTPFLNN